MTHKLFVCSTCASTWKDGKREGISGGEKLLEELSQKHDNWELKDKFPMQSVECMSACNRSCVVSFAAVGKYTYLFGDLPHENNKLDETAVAVLECASLYYQNSSGLLPWSERPKPLKKGVLAKIPPLST